MLERLRSLPELVALPACIIIGLLFFAVTNPKDLPPAALVIGFVILFGIMYSAVRLAAKALNLRDKLPRGRYNGLVLSATLLPVLLIALQSIGQLTVRDIITLVVLFVAVYIYVSRMSGGQ